MRIESGAGDFEMEVLEVESRGSNLVLKSRMGVWLADAELEPQEILHIARLHLKWNVVWYLLRVPWLALRSKRAEANEPIA